MASSIAKSKASSLADGLTRVELTLTRAEGERLYSHLASHCSAELRATENVDTRPGGRLVPHLLRALADQVRHKLQLKVVD